MRDSAKAAKVSNLPGSTSDGLTASDRPCSHGGTLIFNGGLAGLSDSDDVWNLEREQRLISSAVTVTGLR